MPEWVDPVDDDKPKSLADLAIPIGAQARARARTRDRGRVGDSAAGGLSAVRPEGRRETEVARGF